MQGPVTGDSNAERSRHQQSMCRGLHRGQLCSVQHRHQHSECRGLHRGPAVQSAAQTPAQHTHRPPQRTSCAQHSTDTSTAHTEASTGDSYADCGTDTSRACAEASIGDSYAGHSTDTSTASSIGDSYVECTTDTSTVHTEASIGTSYAGHSTDTSTAHAEASTVYQLCRVQHRHQHSIHHREPAMQSRAQTLAQHVQRLP